MNFMKKSLVKGIRGGIGTSGEVEASKGIGALLLSAFDFLTRP